MKKLLIATHNVGKLQEIKDFLSDLDVEIVSLSDLGITEDVEEDGTTYEENSRKKALFYTRLTGLPTISDDGGLEIEALGGQPGIKSRRWLGHVASDDELIEHLKKVSKDLPDENRRAKFATVVSLATPSGEVFSQRGEISGEIAKTPLVNRSEGLPYRSFFYIPNLKKFYFETEMSEDEKIEYSHRRKAVISLIPSIKKVLVS